MIDRRSFLRSGMIAGVATATAGGLVIASESDISKYAGAVGVVDPTHFGLAIDFTVTLICSILVTLLGIHLFNKVEV